MNNDVFIKILNDNYLYLKGIVDPNLKHTDRTLYLKATGPTEANLVAAVVVYSKVRIQEEKHFINVNRNIVLGMVIGVIVKHVDPENTFDTVEKAVVDNSDIETRMNGIDRMKEDHIVGTGLIGFCRGT